MTIAIATGPATRILIVNYHYIIPVSGQVFPGLRGVTPEELERQMITLNRQFSPWTPATLPLPTADCSENLTYLITFDDGCQDLLDWAIPLLRRHGVPAIIFCCSQPYLEHRVLNVQKTHLLQGRWGWGRFQKKFQAALAASKESWVLEDSSHLGLSRMYRYDSDDTAKFKRQLNVELPYHVVDRVLDMLFEAEFGSQAEVAKRLYLSPDAIRRCADLGITIGLHTHSHRMLSRLRSDAQAQELDLALSYFRDELDLEITTLSYPYGIPGSWDLHTKQLAEDRDLTAGLTLGRQVYDPRIHQDPYEIPRYDVNDIFDQEGNLRSDLLL